MAQATLKYGAKSTRDYTAGSATDAGAVVVLADNRIGVVVSALEASQQGEVYIDGVFDIASASATTITAGEAVYIDDSDSDKVIPTGSKATGDTLLGTALVAKTSGQLVATVDLNARVGTVQ